MYSWQVVRVVCTVCSQADMRCGMLSELLGAKDASLVGNFCSIGEVGWRSSTLDVGSWNGLLEFVGD